MARRARQVAYWVWPFVVFFATYFWTNLHSLSSRDLNAYPFAADVPDYTFGRGHESLHSLTAWLLDGYRLFLQTIGVAESAAAVKLPFAFIGALNTTVAIAVFSSLFDKKRSVIFGACYGLSLMVWFFASVPESYALSTLLYSVYLLIFVKATTAAPAGSRFALLGASVLLLALLNDISAVILVLVPAIYYGWATVSDKSARNYLGLQLGVVAAYLVASVILTAFLRTYFNLLRSFSPALVEYRHDFFEPFVNFFFFAVAAPASAVSYANTLTPNYVGFFEPSPFAYFGDPISVAFIAAWLALLSFFRARRVTRHVVALAAFVALRFVLVLVFNPGEAILYVSVATLSFMVVVFHFLESSELAYKNAFAIALLLTIAAANARFFIGR